MKPKRLLGAVVIAGLMCSVLPAGAQSQLDYLIDAHSQFDNGIDVQRIVALMDEAGVRRIILSPRQGGGVSPADTLKAARQYPGRIIPAVLTKGKDPNVSLERVERQVMGGKFEAMSELLVYHAAKGGRRPVPEIVNRLDTPLVRKSIDYAIEQNWPSIIHIEFAALPPAMHQQFRDALEGELNAHPDHPYALIHMGQLQPAEAQDLLARHGNLYFLTSHANVVWIGSGREPWTNLFAGNVLTPEWKRLFLQYPDRFVLAFDNLYDEQWGKFYLSQVSLWRHAFANLPPEVAREVEHENAERLWRLSPT